MVYKALQVTPIAFLTSSPTNLPYLTPIQLEYLSQKDAPGSEALYVLFSLPDNSSPRWSHGSFPDLLQDNSI